MGEINQEYEEIDLRELFIQIWNGRWFIIGITLVAVLFAGVYSFFIAEPVYETSSELLLPDFSLINGNELSKNEYISFIRRPEIKQKIIEEFNLDLTPGGLDRKLSIKQNNNTNNVVFTYKDNDKTLSAEILNKWIDLFRLEVENFIKEKNNNYISNIEELLTEREESYLAAEKKLSKFKEKVNVDLLKMTLNIRNYKLVNFEDRIIDLNQDIAVLKEEDNLLSKQIQETEKYIITSQTIDDNSMESLKNLFQDINNLQALTTKKENINDEYTILQRQKNQTKLDIVSKQRELKSFKKDISLINKEVDKVRNELAKYQEELNLLNIRVEETKQNYLSTENDYSNLIQVLREKDYEVSVINKAVVPEESISPRKKLNIAIAAMLGLFIGVFTVFMKEFLTGEE